MRTRNTTKGGHGDLFSSSSSDSSESSSDSCSDSSSEEEKLSRKKKKQKKRRSTKNGAKGLDHGSTHMMIMESVGQILNSTLQPLVAQLGAVGQVQSHSTPFATSSEVHTMNSNVPLSQSKKVTFKDRLSTPKKITPPTKKNDVASMGKPVAKAAVPKKKASAKKFPCIVPARRQSQGVPVNQEPSGGVPGSIEQNAENENISEVDGAAPAMGSLAGAGNEIAQGNDAVDWPTVVVSDNELNDGGEWLPGIDEADCEDDAEAAETSACSDGGFQRRTPNNTVNDVYSATALTRAWESLYEGDVPDQMRDMPEVCRMADIEAVVQILGKGTIYELITVLGYKTLKTAPKTIMFRVLAQALLIQ